MRQGSQASSAEMKIQHLIHSVLTALQAAEGTRTTSAASINKQSTGPTGKAFQNTGYRMILELQFDERCINPMRKIPNTDPL